MSKEDNDFTVNLTAQEIEILLRGLHELPAKLSMNLILRLYNTVNGNTEKREGAE